MILSVDTETVRELVDEAGRELAADMATDILIIEDEPLIAMDLEALVEGLRAHGHRMVKAVDSPKELAESLRDIAADGDMILCMGAGDITKWAAGLADGIAKARKSKK